MGFGARVRAKGSGLVFGLGFWIGIWVRVRG